MPKAFLSPYGIMLREGGRAEVFPAVDVIFKGVMGEWLSLFFIIDSGASISALPKSDARMLGIDAERGSPVSISGIGGAPLAGWQHLLSVSFGGENIRLPFVFLNTDVGPRVLGRKGVFERFLLVFDEKKRRSAFIGERTSLARSLRKTLDQL